MAVQNLPSAAVQYAREQRLEISAAVAALGRQWRRMGADFDAGFIRVAPTMLDITRTAQERITVGAGRYIPNVLEDTGQLKWLDAAATVNPLSLVGVAGDGRPVESLLYGAVVQSKIAVGSGRTTFQALADAGQWLSMVMGTALSDTGRAAESLHSGVRPVTGYVRMLSPPSCARCAILAGNFYRKNQGFLRHPRCDCRHIPSSESMAGERTVNARAYFDSLPTAARLEADNPLLTVAMRREAGIYSREDIFGRAGADAIREGADINQVVNARRGMSLAQDGRRITTEGTGRRGIASTARTGRTGARLMPETIAAVAKNRDEYMSLLRLNGYIF